MASSFPYHKSVLPEFVSVCLSLSEVAMAQDFTQIVDFSTCIPDRDDHQPYLLDLILTLALLLLILLWENMTIW